MTSLVLKRFVAVMAATYLLGGMAQAATVFTLNEANFGDFTETVDGIELTISSGSLGTLHLNGVGVGVESGAGDQSSNRLGGIGESIIFMFDPVVSILESMVFEVGGGVDTVSILDANDDLITSFEVANNPGNSFVTVDLKEVTGSTFRIVSTAIRSNPLNDDGGVRISSLTVAEAIPVPAALPLMTSGLAAAGLAFCRRKRQAA